MPRLRILLFTLSCGAVAVHAARLPDTGQDICYGASAADSLLPTSAESIARDTGTHPRQDCRYGQDAAAIAGMLIKTGAGPKGFDYTKIANNGTTLAASTALGTANTAWACTRDNSTGLTWEVKTSTATDLRYSGHTYVWLSSDGNTNGGDAGVGGSGTSCNVMAPDQCNTQQFTGDVNAAQLCTYADWRMPTQRELLTLVNADGSIPAIASLYFPNTPSSEFWSASTAVFNTAFARFVTFSIGSDSAGAKTLAYSVRLVRGGQF